VLPVREIQGAEITTIEGLATSDELHPIQQAFVEHGGLQCGFCTPGMILSAHALLKATPRPTREQIIAGMDENLCRCGAHQRFVLAIESAAARPGGAP
jgi:aerobic-type carbon monoxide dehydrogenase small subunit (CoxS/CutS family)